jgi:small-conductance mechanosensitive channel
MKLILALLAGLALALYILALADGPSLLDIINQF